MQRLRCTAVLSMVAVVLMVSADAQTARKKPVKKALTPAVASKRSKSKTSRVASRHSRSGIGQHEQVSSGTSRVRARRVVITRKKINGRWVRVTRVVRSELNSTYQPHPDPDRYKEIQQALAANGYFKGEPNGQWESDSVAALKQFQTDKNIPNDGKISALSLIGLGLGPRHDPAVPPVTPAPSTADSAAIAPEPAPPASN